MVEDKLAKVGHVLHAAEAADNRLDVLEAEELRETAESYKVAFSLATDGWTNDSGDEDHPYQYRLAVDGVVAASGAEAVFDDASITVAEVCCLDPTTYTEDGYVVFRSYEVPSAALTGVLHIEQHAAALA
ncbi:MAG: hypothetical protein IJ042_01950 [Butyricicoccus sp.]|nr:hypothetical protein [Butyricicoccus sp.]